MKTIRFLVIVLVFPILTTASIISAQTVNSEWLGDGTGNFNNGNWSNSTLWNPTTVPNNSGPAVYDVTVPFYPGGQGFNGPELDINVTIRNLTTVNRAFIDNQGFSGTNLTVTGSTTFTTTPGHDGEYSAIFFSGGTLSLGTLTNYTAATKTLEAGFLFPLNGGTIRFRGADIVTNNATLIVGDGSQLLNQDNGAIAYANLAVNNGGFNLGGGHNFTTVGNFTNNGGLSVGTSGPLSSTFTVGGVLTNFDAATRTLSGGYDFTVDSSAGTGTATLRFAGADIRSIVNTAVNIRGAGASIQDLAGQNALRNLQGIQFGTLTNAGTMTITPAGGTFSNNGATHNIYAGANITIQGNHSSTNGGTTNIGAPTDTSNTTLHIAGSAVIQGGGLDFGGQPGVNTQYHTVLQIMNGIEFRGAYITGTGTTFADVGLIQGSVLNPGHSPGQLTFQGALTLDSTTTSQIQIGGLTPGEGFDQVVQSGGLLTLGGTLDLSVIDGFENSIDNSDTFDIFTSNQTLGGSFTNVASGQRLTTSDGLGSFLVTYSGQQKVTLSNFQLVLKPTSAVSRKTHGAAGTFDVLLPLTGAPGVECRSGGGNHTFVFTFTNDIADGDATITAGAGNVIGSPVFAGKTMTVNVTGVNDVQTITLTLSDVTDTYSQVLPDTLVSVKMLVGDTNGSSTVSAADIGQTKGQAGSAVTVANFREDVTPNGSITASDVALVKSNSGHSLP